MLPSANIETIAPAEVKTNEKYRPMFVLRGLLWLVALALGLAEAWVARSAMYPDGVSYLDLGDVIWRGDWHNAISGYWSPLYPATLGLFVKVFQPSIYGEYPLVHLVNFLIYVVALVCFDFFLRTFIGQQRERNREPSGQGEFGLPIWAWYVVGYCIFISSSLLLITISFVSGDMAIAAVIYAASALVLQIRADKAGPRTFASLGALLAIGYLTKAVMFVMAVPFILVAGRLHKSLKNTAIAFASFALVAAPWVLALSLAKHRLTFGDTGTINYVINVSHGQFYIPKTPDTTNPVSQIATHPEAYEYASPIPGTYPLWFDPSYWHEGVRPHFNLKQQSRAIALSLASCGWILFNVSLGFHITLAILFLYLISPQPRLCLQRLPRQWPLWLPALTGVVLYCLVVIEYRYVAAQFSILWIVALSGVKLPALTSSRRIITAVVVFLACATCAISARDVLVAAQGREFIARRIANADCPRVAAALQSSGIRPGDKLAVISDWLFPAREGAYVSRLARAQIIGEVRADEFWQADHTIRSKLIDTYAMAGAKAMLAYNPPGAEPGWQRLNGTNYYVYLLTSEHLGDQH